MLVNLVDYSKYESAQGKQKSLEWADACKLFAQPKATTEIKSTELKTRKKELETDKHAAGFVFWGKSVNGRKRKDDIINHSAVALDYDDVKEDKDTFLGKVHDALDGYNYMYYSTTKCTNKDLRLRVIIPLSAPISGDKYQAVGRALITMISTDGVDKSTLEDNRAMGYTVKLADVDYIYKAVTDAQFLDADAFLKDHYKDWHDVSEWFQFEDEKEIVKKAERRASKEANGGKGIAADEYVDAANRKGVEGAFCRVYTIAQAIEKYLPDVYVPYRDGRYTYTGGEGAGGLVVFGTDGGRAVFSHHSTDPAKGRVLNAFQLVQVHRYGNLDTGTYTYESKKPSYQQTKKWAMDIPEVVRELRGVKAPVATLDAGVMQSSQQFLDAVEYPANDYGIAKAMSVVYKDKYRWAEDAGTWLEYDGIRWVEIKQTRLIGAFALLAKIYQSLGVEAKDSNIIEHISSCVDYCQKNNLQKMALEQLKDMLRTKLSDMDADNWLINTKNGVIDLKALEEGREWLLPHSPNFLLMKVMGAGIPKDFVPDPACDKFIMDTLPDEEVREYVQMLTGYTLCGSTSEKKLFILWGEKGNNGKTMFANLWRNMLGDYAATAEDKMILTSKNDSGSESATPFLASLKGARLAVTEEIAAGRKLDSAVVKRITGSAMVKCRKLRQDPIEYKPTYKLVICANDAPTLQDANDTAMQIRTRIIPFDAFFSVKAGNLDPEIEEKIETPEWKNTFLDWALVGYAKWREKGRLDNFTGDMSVFESDMPKRMKQSLSAYLSNSDEIGDFIMTYLDVTGDKKDFLSTSDLYDLYIKENSNSYQTSARVFKIQLAKAMQSYECDGVVAGRKRLQDNAGLCQNARGYYGIRWLDMYSDDNDIDRWEKDMQRTA